MNEEHITLSESLDEIYDPLTLEEKAIQNAIFLQGVENSLIYGD